MTEGLDLLPSSKLIPLHKHCMCVCLYVSEGEMENQIINKNHLTVALDTVRSDFKASLDGENIISTGKK